VPQKKQYILASMLSIKVRDSTDEHCFLVMSTHDMLSGTCAVRAFATIGVRTKTHCMTPFQFTPTDAPPRHHATSYINTTQHLDQNRNISPMFQEHVLCRVHKARDVSTRQMRCADIGPAVEQAEMTPGLCCCSGQDTNATTKIAGQLAQSLQPRFFETT
jgi:hypothetical protein